MLTEEMKAHNLEVVRRALQSSNATGTEKECLSILQELGNYVLNWIKNKTYTYLDDTYNLTDSTGCAIYKDGKLTEFKYYAEKQAAEPRIITYKRQRIVVNGRQLLTKALDASPLASMGKYSLVVLSEAPYGLWVNESLGDGGSNKRGKGWFDALKKDVENKFEVIKKAHGFGAQRK